MVIVPRNLLQPLPPEILSIVFGNLEVRDLYSLALVCSKFHETIKGNKMMFRSVYLNILDNPEDHITPGDEWDWEEEVHRYSRIRQLMMGDKFTTQEKRARIQEALHSIVQLTQYANPESEQSRNINLIRGYFNQKRAYTPNSNLAAFCCQSELYSRAFKDTEATESVKYRSFSTRQASAKLHVFLGSPVSRMPRDVYADLYPYAISKVYDLRNYTPATLWGPYLPDGEASVDWEKMEAIMVIIGHNIRDFAVKNRDGTKSPLYSFEWDGLAPNSYRHRALTRSMRMDGEDALDFKDPYNVTGSWMRIVTFLDFHELFHYNFTNPQPPPNEPRPAHDTREACRLIMMELRATRLEQPGPEDGQDYPVVHFSGSAYSMHHNLDPNAFSSLTGSVRQTKEGHIRWTTLSIYGGEERWKSECIQVGGINSARGVLGHWFDKDWDRTGPAGPTAFWKISDDIDDPTQRNQNSTEISSDDEDFLGSEVDEEVDEVLDEEEEVEGGHAGEDNGGNDDSDQEFRTMAEEIMARYAEEIAEARAVAGRS